MDDLIADFLTETNEGLSALDVALVKLEKQPDDRPTLSEIFRVIHTIKGTCGFLGLPRLEKVAHAAENVLGRYRDGALRVTPDGITLILQALDAIKAIVAGLEQKGAEPPGDDAALIAALDAAADGRDAAPPPAAGGDVFFGVFADYFQNKATFALTSVRGKPAADNSTFAGALLESLHDRADSTRSDQAFTFRELATRVEVKVRDRTGGRQTPGWERLEPGTGDIVFVPSYLVPTPSELTLRRRHAATMVAAYGAFAEGNIPTVHTLLDALRAPADQLDLRAFDWFYLWRKSHEGSDRLPGHGAAVMDIVRLPARGAFATLFTDNTLRISAEADLAVRAIRYGDRRINQGSVAVSGAQAALDLNDEIVIWDAETGRAGPPLKLPERRGGSPAACSAFALSPDGKRAYWAGYYHRIGEPARVGLLGAYRVVVWDLPDGAVRADDRFQDSLLCVIQFQFSEDGSRLALLLGEPFSNLPMPDEVAPLPPRIEPMPANEVAIVDPGPQLMEKVRLKGTTTDFRVLDLAFHPSRTEIFASVPGPETNSIVRWSIEPPGPPKVLFGDKANLSKIALSPDGSLLAAACGDGLVRLWDMKSNALIGKFAEHGGGVSAVAFLGDGKKLVSGGTDGQIVLWDVERLRRSDEFPAWRVHDDRAGEIWFAGDDSTLVLHRLFSKTNPLTQNNAAIEVWNIEKRQQVWSKEFYAFSPPILWPPWRSRDGRLLVLAADDTASDFILREAASGKVLGRIAGPPPVPPPVQRPFLNAVAAAPDASAFALGDSTGLVRVWSADRPAKTSEFQTGLSELGSLAFQPKTGTLLVGGSGTGTEGTAPGIVQFWRRTGDAGRFEKDGEMSFHYDPVQQIEFGPEGKIAAILTRPPQNSETTERRPRPARFGLVDVEARKILGEQSWAGFPQFGPVAWLRFSDDERVLMLRKGAFNMPGPPPGGLLALEPRSGAVRAVLEDSVMPASSEFDHSPRPPKTNAQPELLLASERTLRFFEPFTFARSGAASVPDWAGFPFAVSPSGRRVAYARGGTIGVLRAADRAETDGQVARVRSWIEQVNGEVCAYGLGALGFSGYSPRRSVGILISALQMEDENVRRAALLRLQSGGDVDRKSAEWAQAAVWVAVLVRSEYPDERVVAVDTLGRMGLAEGFILSGLHARLRDPDTRVAAHAYAAALALKPDDVEATRLFILGFRDGTLTGDLQTRDVIVEAVSRRLPEVPDHLEDLAVPLAIGLKKIQGNYPAMYYYGALERMGTRAAPAVDILLDLVKAGEPPNRLPAVALAYIAPDEPKVTDAILPVLIRVMEGANRSQYPDTARALAYLGAKAKPALASLKKAAGRNSIGTAESQFAIRIIEAPEGSRNAVLSAILADPKSPLQYAAFAYLARVPTLRAELRPELEALLKNPALNPNIKQSLERLLRASLTGFANLQRF